MLPPLCVRAAASSNNFIPRSSVFPKLTSSSWIVPTTRASAARNSGKALPIVRTTAGTTSLRNPVRAPRNWCPNRTARRSTRRST